VERNEIMSRRRRASETNEVPAAAVDTAMIDMLDPPESGPPTEEELGAEDVEREATQRVPGVEREESSPGESPTTDDPRTTQNDILPAPSFTTILASMDREAPAGWPKESPFKVNWPWSEEVDPQPGDPVGWNWHRKEIAVVTAVPPVMEPWPYTLTIEIRPMPAYWNGSHKVFNLRTGERIERVAWYTRWNRAYSEKPAKQPERIGSDWLAVVPEGT
jgi:hypothetical protein